MWQKILKISLISFFCSNLVFATDQQAEPKLIQLQQFPTSELNRDFFQLLNNFEKTRAEDAENPGNIIETRSFTSANKAFSIICKGNAAVGYPIVEASCSFVFDTSKTNIESGTDIQKGKLFDSIRATVSEDFSPQKFATSANFLPLNSLEKVQVVLPNGKTAEYPVISMDCKKGYDNEAQVASSCIFTAIPQQGN